MLRFGQGLGCDVLKSLANHLNTAHTLYPVVLKSLQAFEWQVDNHVSSDDEFDQAYQKLADDLAELTGKDMGEYLLWEWWEVDGVEALAFKIALPKPVACHVGQDDLTDIVRTLKHEQTRQIAPFINEPHDKTDEFIGCCEHYLDSYLHELLAVNFPKSYDYDLFCSHKIDGNHIEFGSDDIIDVILSGKSYQSQKQTLFKRYR